jgi:hypothetical protein
MALQQVPDGYTQLIREEIGVVRHRLSRYVNRNDPRLHDPREPLKGTVTLEHFAPDAVGTGPGQIVASSDPRLGKTGMDPGARVLESVGRDKDLRADRSQILAAARLLGFDPMRRADSMSPRQLNADHAIVSGELYLFPVECLWDITSRGITYAVGEGTALSGATLVRFGAFELQADGSLTLRAQTANVATTAFTSASGRQIHPYRTTTTLPRYYRLSATAYGYAWGFVAVGTLSGGFLRGTKLNGTQDLYPSSALVVTGQSDLPATIAAGAPVVSSKLAWGAISE